MDNKAFLKKMRDILKKTHHDYLVVSDDPDCECDYGIDSNGHIIIHGASSLFLLSELENITYHDDDEMDIDEAYIHFSFKNDTDLFLNYSEFRMLGDDICIYLRGHSQRDEISRKILYHFYDWNYLNNDYLIDDTKTLIAYIGNDKKVEIPDGIVKIGNYAFYGANTVKEVILPDTLTEIGDFAFIGGNILKSIDLNKVEVIGEGAFQGRNIENIIIPKSVKKIGKDAFHACHPALVDNLINYSSVTLDDNIIKARDW